jgi:uncharacterized protein YwgA
MEVFTAILQLLKESGDKIDSKTKIHKEMFFLSKILKVDFGFRPHYYGPYSPEVEETLDGLSGANFIQVNVTSYGVAGNRGFEVMRYDYSLTESGKRLLEEMGEIPEKEDIHLFVSNLNKVGNPDYMDLSIAAKVLYITNKNNSVISCKDIDKSSKILNALGFYG